MIKQIVLKIMSEMNLVRGDLHRNDRQGALHRAWGHIFNNHLVGDYVEFGVYKGDGVVASLRSYAEFSRWLEGEKVSAEEWRQEVAKKSPLNRMPQFHCLDTFGGMPSNEEGSIAFEGNTFQTNLEDVRKKVSENNSLNCEIRYYPGLFSETSDKFRKDLTGRKIAIANIDCDLMESTVDALNAIKDYIDIGTIILFDDYNTFNADREKGQRKAFANFQSESMFVFEQFFSYQYSGQSFLLIGKK